MKGFFLAFVITVAALTGSSAFAADERNVTVVNGTGYGIKFLGFNNLGDNDWSDNELGGVLANGGNIYVKFNTADKGCKWNFKIEWADTTVTFRWSSASAEDPLTEMTRLAISNHLVI